MFGLMSPHTATDFSSGSDNPRASEASSSLTAALHPSVGSPWPSGWAGRGMMAVVGRSLRAFSEVATFAQTTGLVNNWRAQEPEPANWPSRPLRIGLLSPGTWATSLVAARGVWQTEWFVVPSEAARASACTAFTLDAVVRPMGTEGVEVDVSENPGQDAAWFDWGQARPLSYPGVFPARFDPARLTLTTGQRDDAQVLRSLIETAALLSRHPSRLTPHDRVYGRRPFQTAGDSFNVGRCGEFAAEVDGPARSMEALASLLPFSDFDSTAHAAARVLSAYLATSPRWPNERARLMAMDACGSVCADEPDTMLRLAAVRLGMGQDDAGLDALERADRMLRDNQIVSSTTQAAFISAELEHGHPGPLTIGRLAAGICMLVSTMPASQVPYFRDDLLDDMRFCSLLIGRDQDRRLLMQVFRMLERVRRAECFGLPVSVGIPATAAAPLPEIAEAAPVLPASAVTRTRAAKPKTVQPKAKTPKGKAGAKPVAKAAASTPQKGGKKAA